MSARDDVTAFALEQLRNNPNGIRYGELHKLVRSEYPNMKQGTVSGSIRNFINKNEALLYKPEKGLYRLKEYQDNNFNGQQNIIQNSSIKEEDYYESFSEWLINDLEECNKSMALGGNRFGGKWGTPDVIGVLKPGITDIIKNEIEITSAEIKLDINQLITAFGQACSYRLFSHKVYLVIPKQSNVDEISRLDSLSCLFGIGLVLYDSTNPDDPDYKLRNRATKGNPDNFYVNKNMKLIADELFN